MSDNDTYASDEYEYETACDLSSWADEHHEVLAELYSQFLASGRLVFGQSFHHASGFAEFANFVYNATV